MLGVVVPSVEYSGEIVAAHLSVPIHISLAKDIRHHPGPHLRKGFSSLSLAHDVIHSFITANVD